MARAPKTAASAAAADQAEARALVDLPAFGVLVGGLVVAAPAAIAQLAESGQADPHPDAVAYAKTLKD